MWEVFQGHRHTLLSSIQDPDKASVPMKINTQKQRPSSVGQIGYIWFNREVEGYQTFDLEQQD